MHVPTSRLLALDRHFAVGKWLVQLGRNEQKSGTTRRKPTSEQLCRATDCRFGEQRLRPATNVAQLRRAPRQQTECRAQSVRGAKKMRHRVPALREDIGADSRLVVEQGTFVWVGGWCVHARPEIDVHTAVAFPALDDNRGGIGAEARGMHE